MQQRIGYVRVAPQAAGDLTNLSAYLQSRTLDKRLRYLVELRVSQINGCAFCMDMHSHARSRCDLR